MDTHTAALDTAPLAAARTPIVGGLTTLVAVALPVAAILTAESRGVEVAPGLIDWIFVGGVLVVTAATFALLVPWALRGAPARTSRTAITLSGIALLVSTIFFWTMVPVAFGSAGAWLGHLERGRASATGAGRGLPTAALVLGAIAALGSVAAYVATS